MANYDQVNSKPLPWVLYRWRSSGRRFDEPHDFEGIQYETAIHCAAMRGDIQAFEYILDEIPDALYCLTRNKETVLYLAARNNQVFFVNYLLLNCNIGTRFLSLPQFYGETPLFCAMNSECLDMVKLLVLHGVSFSARRRRPLAQLEHSTNVKYFLSPLRKWLVAMIEEYAAWEKKFKLQSEKVAESSWPIPQDATLRIISFLDVKDCAKLQAVSTSMRKRVKRRVNRYTILLHILDTYHPKLKTGQMIDTQVVRTFYRRRHIYEIFDKSSGPVIAIRREKAREYTARRTKALGSSLAEDAGLEDNIRMSPEMFYILYEI